MEAVFDIDGTLANAEHRLHHINDTAYWISKNGKPPMPDWETFLSDEKVAGDAPIPEIWRILKTMARYSSSRIIFITGRPEAQRQTTWNWLFDRSCPIRDDAWRFLIRYERGAPPLYMRKDGDRRPSHVVKEELLLQARADGFNPIIAFEDRKEDAAMWRRNGLRCLQVAEGDY